MLVTAISVHTPVKRLAGPHCRTDSPYTRPIRGEPLMKHSLTVVCLVAAAIVAPQAQVSPIALPHVAPAVDQILSLKRAGSPEISPDGQHVAYTVRLTNWDDNAYE